MATAARRAELQDILARDSAAPSPSEWGPHLWRMLHWLAERVGFQQSKILADDEMVAWRRIFKVMSVVLPCALCKGHYTEYFNSNFDLNMVGSVPNGIDRYELIKKWVYELHEAVNSRGKKPSYSFDKLAEEYGWGCKFSFEDERRAFYNILMRALRQNIVKREDVIQLQTTFANLYNLYRPIVLKKPAVVVPLAAPAPAPAPAPASAPAPAPAPAPTDTVVSLPTIESLTGIVEPVAIEDVVQMF